jgi:hypothetical protein
VLAERERVKKNTLGMIVKTGVTGNLSGNRSGRAGLKEGADVARKKSNHRKEGDTDHRRWKHSPRKKGRVTPLGCSGRTAVRREQLAYLPHARTAESRKPRSTHATIDLRVFIARC